MRVSAVLSIHNRGHLWKRALLTYLGQTMPRKDWEILLVDDQSTEDLTATYMPYVGELNIRHVRMDHTRHPIFRQRNPNWKPGDNAFVDWYHTPALSINLGTHLAKGDIICLCHPEIMHGPTNLELATRLLDSNPHQYLFGRTYLGQLRTNAWLDEHPEWIRWEWEKFIYMINRPYPLQFFGSNELYWYTSFLPKAAVQAIGGVDFSYMGGVAGEDDDFRDRIKLAGYPPVHIAELEGLHQDHSDEPEAHRNRATQWWQDGLTRNRAIYYARREGKAQYPTPANVQYDWTARECLVSVTEYRYGQKEPVAQV